MEPKQWVGIDVSGKRLEVFVRPIQRILKVANSPAGLATLVSELLGIDPALIVIEATANWHLAAVAALSGAGLPVAVINPRQARNFARATGQLAKTDPIDARLLAHFAEAIHPPVRVLPDEQTQELAEWVQRRHQLVEMLTAERNRLRAMSGSARADIETHIDWLEKRLVRLDEELERLIADNPVWKDLSALLCSVPGVGSVVSATLIANLPELGSLSHKQIAALVGVAPLNRDSGQTRGHRTTWGGRAPVRTMLYLACVVGIRFNPIIRRFYQRLKQAGKPSKVALVACMRKLLVSLNAMAKTQTQWQS